MSAPLVWEIIKANNSFLVKRCKSQFSRESTNLLNKNAFKYSGLANAKAIGVAPSADNKGVVLSVKTKKSIAKSAVKSSGVRRVAKAVNGLTVKRSYRKDLQQAALARVSAILRSQKVKKTAAKKSRRAKKLAA